MTRRDATYSWRSIGATYELLERLGAQRVYPPVVGVPDWSAPLASWMDNAKAFADDG